METTVLVAEGERIVRDGLCGILAAHPELRVVAQAGDGRRAVLEAREQKPDIALVGSHLSRLCGVEAIRDIRAESPRTRCILLSSHGSAERVRQALLAGAQGFLLTDSSSAELVEAIWTVRSGRSYLAPAVADQVVGAITASTQSGGSLGLTRRQREVLQLIAEGLSTREIAAELGISLKTAQTHRANLMFKVGVHRTSGLVRYAIREGIVAA